MRTKSTLTLTTTLLCLFVFGGKAEGQTTAPKSELGVHFSALAINDPTNDFLISCQSCDTFVYTGIGGRFTYNLNDSLAIDSELNFFTRENRKNTSRVVGGKPIEGLFGLKVGKRFERAGVFGKVRPGFLSFSHTISSGLGGIGTPFSRRTHLAVDVGGVFELYPSHKVLVRVDVGDTIIRYGEENVEGGLIPVVNASTRHSLQFSAGVGYRF